MDKEARNTFLIIAIVLIASTVSLVVIFNLIWDILQRPVDSVITTVSDIVDRSIEIDYNFEVPEINNELAEQVDEEPQEEEEEPEPVAEETPLQDEKPTEDIEIVAKNPEINARVIDYNFTIPELPESEKEPEGFKSIPDAIVDDAKLAEALYAGNPAQVNFNIQIPKIGINSPVLQGRGSDELLTKGFWVHPGSHTLGEGEVVMLCHRRYFGPYDPRSCWFLDKLQKGDEIFINYSDVQLTYKVVGINVFDGDDPLIYSISDEDDYIKISTCTPLYSNAQRLVVLAERVE
jgi:LPXTG-site transpeptidase (sortase) family protein